MRSFLRISAAGLPATLLLVSLIVVVVAVADDGGRPVGAEVVIVCF